MKTNKTNEIKLPTIEDFNKIENFANAVITTNSILSAFQNHFELLKRIGDVELIINFDMLLRETYSNIVESFKTKLTHEDKD